MKFQVKHLLYLTLLVAMFLGGWLAKSNYDRWQSKNDTVSLPPPTVYSVPPNIDGVVLSTKNNLAAVSIGTDDGLKPGDVMVFYRGTTAVGRGQVMRAQSNISAVRMLQETQVAEGDSVRLR